MFGRRMLERSARMGRDREVGFTPVRNEAIDKNVQAHVALIQVAEITEHGRALPAHEALDRAWSAVRKTLPMGRMVRRYRGAGLSTAVIDQIRQAALS